jgi:hypothetical protein
MANPAQIERTLVLQIIPALAALSGAELEEFGVRIASLYADVPLRHRGVGLKGNPQGRTIDAYSDDGLVAAQFGSEAGYFNTLAKPKSDYKQVRTQMPTARTIYLMSSQIASAQRQRDLLKWEAEVAANGIHLRVLDAQAVAEYIVRDVMEREAAFERIADFLEPLRYLRDLRPSSHRLPPLADGFVARQDVVRDTVAMLEAHQVGLLWGISGIGKSQIAIAAAGDPWREFDWTVWARKVPLRSAADLEAVDVTGRGIRHNLLGMIGSRPILLVLDDPQLDVPVAELMEQIRRACGADARVLITAQIGFEGGDALKVPFMDGAEARRVLERGASRCPDEEFETIQRAVGGHPMGLRLLNALTGPETVWEEIAEQAHRVGQLAEPERAVRLVDMVLAHRRDILQEPLGLFTWCRAPLVHAGMLRAVAGLQAANHLQSLGLASVDQPDTLRLHDIVWSSLPELRPPIEVHEAEFEDRLDRYVRRLAGRESGSLTLNHLARVHQELLARLVGSGRCRDGHLYAWLHHRGPGEVTAARLPDPLALARRVAGGEADEFSVQTAVELAEAMVQVTTARGGAPADAALLLAPFDALLGSPNLSPSAGVRVRHHRAKALKRLGRPVEAISELEKIVAELGEESTPPAVRLLLARTLAELPRDAGIETGDRPRELLRRLLEEARRDPGAVSDNVVLAVAELLRWRNVGADAGAFLAEYGDLFEPRIVTASQRGLEQGALAFAALAGVWGTKDPERFWKIFDALPLPAADDLHDRSEIEAWGEILSNAAEHDAADREELLCQSLALFSRSDSHYARTHRADVLRRLHRCGEARAVLEELLEEDLPPRQRAWALFRLAETHADLGDTQAARLACEGAIASATGPRDRQRFHDWMAALPSSTEAVAQTPTDEMRPPD